MNNISLDTKVQSHLNNLMMISLKHSAAVIEYATQNITAGIMACRVTRKDNSTYDLGAEKGRK